MNDGQWNPGEDKEKAILPSQVGKQSKLSLSHRNYTGPTMDWDCFDVVYIRKHRHLSHNHSSPLLTICFN